MKTLIIAEAGVNHNGDLDLARRLIDSAAHSGADIVKFQTFRARSLASPSAEKAKYQFEGTSKGETQLRMLEQLELPQSWHAELIEHSKDMGIRFASTAFDSASLDFLANLDLPFLKIPSGEITNSPLLLRFARTGQELILSTGMSRLGEVEEALATLAWGYSQESQPSGPDDIWQNWSVKSNRDSLLGKVTLLHCTSSYPAPLESVNLNALDTLRSAFGLPVGYSDHTQGQVASLAAVSKGASVIEKHFTLDRTMRGPDHKASLEPNELFEFVRAIRDIEIALGDGTKVPQASEFDTMQVARQRLVAAEPIRAGQVFTENNLTTSRSKSGILPTQIWSLIGLMATKDYEAGEEIEIRSE